MGHVVDSNRVANTWWPYKVSQLLIKKVSNEQQTKQTTTSKASNKRSSGKGISKSSTPKVRKTKGYLVGDKRVDTLIQGKHYVVKYHTNRYTKTALVKKGRTKVTVCTIDTPVRIEKLPIAECKWMDVLFDYDPKTSAGRFLYYGKYRGITKGAENFLKELKPDEQAPE